MRKPVPAGILLTLLWITESLAPSQVFPKETEASTTLALEAALIYNVTRFVIWPEQAFTGSDAPIHICATGKRGKELSEMIKNGTVNKKSQNRSVTTSFLETIEEDIGKYNCHILCLADVPEKQVAKMLRETDTSHMLVIADSQDLLDAGAMISVFVKDNKMALLINIESLIAGSRVKLRDALFTIGTVVRPDGKK